MTPRTVGKASLSALASVMTWSDATSRGGAMAASPAVGGEMDWCQSYGSQARYDKITISIMPRTKRKVILRHLMLSWVLLKWGGQVFPSPVGRWGDGRREASGAKQV